MPSVMDRKTKCKCRKLNLPQAGKVVVRCALHRGKPSKSGRLACYLDDDGIVRSEQPLEVVPLSKPRKPRRTRRAQHTADGFIYYARFEGLIKIGHSKTPEWRAAALNAELLATEPGDREYEKKIHREFAHLRERGEWFRPDALLLERIEELKL